MSDISFDTDDFLAHHGVLGMHWGQRKDKDLSPDEKAKRIDNLGFGAANAGVLAIGAVAVSALTHNPRTRLGAGIVAAALGGTSLAYTTRKNRLEKNK